MCSLIKRNKRIQHINLQGTGLSEMMMVKVANAVARAKSLTSIHLCSNPGTTYRVKEHIHKRVRAMPHRQLVNFPFGETINAITGQKTLLVLKR